MQTDSKLALGEAIAQNPSAPCPEEVLSAQGLMEVSYFGFDHRLHVGQIVVAQSVMAEVEAFFDLARDLRFPIAKAVPAAAYDWDDDRLMADNVTSGFNYRRVAGSDVLSRHALGQAFDINPVQNPYVRYERGKPIIKPKDAVWRPGTSGTLSAEHPLVRLMRGFGWEWGGDWTAESGRIDYQHFQKST